MKKNESKNQLLFNTLLDEVDGMLKLDEKGSLAPFDEVKEADFPLNEQQSLAQEKIKEKRKELVKQRYTKYCIEWILGLHLKTRLTSDFVPHIDKILPLHRTNVDGKSHNFLSALVGFKDYQGAHLYLSHPDVQKMLFSENAPLLLNMETMKKDLKMALMDKKTFQNKDFLELWGVLKQIYGLPKLMQQVLFEKEEATPLNIKEKALFFKNGPKQSALSFLITQGAFMESLDYIASLPAETTLAEVSALVDDPSASKELNRLASRKHFKAKEEVIFLNTLEENLPTAAFLHLTQQYQGVKSYKEDEIGENLMDQKPLLNLKKKEKNTER